MSTPPAILSVLSSSNARTARREDLRLITGGGCYAADWNLPGQVHAAFLRADRAHAEIVRIDVSAARAAPGVLAVYTGITRARESVEIWSEEAVLAAAIERPLARASALRERLWLPRSSR